MRVFVSAGEASADALAAPILAALSRRLPIRAFGMGGPALREVGARLVADASQVSVVGLWDVARRLHRIVPLLRRLGRSAAGELDGGGRAELALLFDLPDFHRRLAPRLRALGIPVIWVVGPSVWAWRPGRARDYGRFIDHLQVLFPFEVPAWQRVGVDVCCIGHPLVDRIPAPSAQVPDPDQIAVLPGSRRSELRHHLPVLEDAMKLLLTRRPRTHFVVPVAPSLDGRALARLPARRVTGESDRWREIGRSAAVWVASGTATLEVALLQRPMVVFYRVDRGSHLLLRPWIRVEHLGLPNLLTGRRLVPELIQSEFRPDRLVETTLALPFDGSSLSAVRAALPGPGAAERSAAAIEGWVRSRGLGPSRSNR